MEKEAEHRVLTELLKIGVLLARPEYDSRGTDLLALSSDEDRAVFLRLQCKGRSTQKKSFIEIPVGYVSDSFVVFLYTRNKSITNLFCFFRSEIKLWEKTVKNKKEYYILPIAIDHAKQHSFESALWGSKRAALFKLVISKADAGKELVYAIRNAAAHATSVAPEPNYTDNGVSKSAIPPQPGNDRKNWFWNGTSWSRK
ncbi:MAG: hypothetical protein AB7F43_11680 [Bacteriovoracia bacterium]